MSPDQPSTFFERSLIWVVLALALLSGISTLMIHFELQSTKDQLHEEVRKNRDETLKNREETLKNREETKKVQALLQELVDVEKKQR